MPPDTRTRLADHGDPTRDPARAAALHRLAVATAPAPARSAASPAPGRAEPAEPAEPVPTHTAPWPTAPWPTAPWATAVDTATAAAAHSDPDGIRPERISPPEVDVSAWADPPWWRRIRWSPDRMAGVALVVVVLALGVFSVHRLLSTVPADPAVPDLPLATPGEIVPADGTPAPGAPVATAAAAPEEADELVVVSVVGLVGRSGLVTVTPGARVADALDRAGGVLEGGDRDGLNLARRVVDGEQILVGVAPGPDGPRGPRSGIVGPEGGAAPTAGAPGAAGTAPGQPAPGQAAPGQPAPAQPAPGQPAAGGPVNLNTADAAALDSLPGVGPVTAAAILSWRAANGSFTSVDQLAEVDGIGPATLAKLRPLVTV